MKKNGPLPIGSVVQLEGGEIKLMILGYLKYGPHNKTDIYDYAGCVYPKGYRSLEETYVFNHKNIEKVYAIGFQDERQEEFEKVLMEQFERSKGSGVFD